MPPRLVGGRDLVRVDEGLAVDGVREVLHAVVADALGEPEARRLLLGGPLRGQRARWLQVLAGGGGLLPHRGGHADPVLEVVLRVRVREVADAVRPDALGELHRLVPSGELLVAPLAACRRCRSAVPVSEGAFEPQPAPIRATMARAASGRDVSAHCCILGSWVGSAYMGGQPSIDGLGAQLVVPGLVAVDLAQPVRGAVLGQPRRGLGGPDVDRVPRHVSRRVGGGHPAGGLRLRAVLRDRLVEELLLVLRGAPAAVDDELDPVVRGIGRGLAQGTEQRRGRGWPHPGSRRRRPSCRRGRHRRPRRARHGARREDSSRAAVEDATPSRTRTPATGSRGLRRSPR